tara:strand:- start:598 stop:954 length:357 start_codon:yes stop_codon:yes gene_type:complete
MTESTNPPNSGPEVLYVQGMSNPGIVGQYPETQATFALVLSVLAIAAGCGLCTAIPGLMMANTALETTSQHPGHPDQGVAKAAQVIGWIGIVMGIIGLILVLLYFGLLAVLFSSGEMA